VRGRGRLPPGGISVSTAHGYVHSSRIIASPYVGKKKKKKKQAEAVEK
jgi:hypothetical protein